jgi:hypothetical protein
VMNKACILKLGRKLQLSSHDLCVRLCGENTVEKRRKMALLLEVLIRISALEEYNFSSIGMSMNICNDAWIDKGFRIGDLELDIPDQLQNAKVVALVDEFGMWNMELLQGWLPTYIINKIAALPPHSNIAGADVHICMENTTGKIVMVDMYNDLFGFNEDGNYDLDWRKIWKLMVPMRVRSFVWMMKNGRLLTNSHKNKMGLRSAMSVYYGDLPETILHVMRDCSLGMPLWLNVVHMNARSKFSHAMFSSGLP